MTTRNFISLFGKPVFFFSSIVLSYFVLFFFFATLSWVQKEELLKIFRMQYGIEKETGKWGICFPIQSFYKLRQNPHRGKVQQLLRQGDFLQAAETMQKYADEFQLKPQIAHVSFRLVKNANYVMFTQRENQRFSDKQKSSQSFKINNSRHNKKKASKKVFSSASSLIFGQKKTTSVKMSQPENIKRSNQELIRFIIDMNAEQIRHGLPGIDLTDADNFLSTLNHELRHIEQYLFSVHFHQYQDEANQVFWVEHDREIDERINQFNALNSRMEADAYIHQLLLGGMTAPYRNLILTRLTQWYLPVIAPQSKMKLNIEKILQIYSL